MINLRPLGAGTASRALAVVLLSGATMFAASGCSTAPSVGDRAAFVEESAAATSWFKTNVNGLDGQIASSAGYIVFPSIGQWGMLWSGGKFGRGVLCKADGTQIGWAAINTLSLGLQVGVQGFKMFIVLQNNDALLRFQENRFSGGVMGTIVLGKGEGALAPFESGVALYQGANTGLMAGVNVGLDRLRYEPL